MFLNRQKAIQTHFCCSNLNISKIIWLRVTHFAWFLSNNYNRLLLSFLAYQFFWLQLILVLMPGCYFQSNTLVGERFFIKNCRAYSYFESVLVILGESRGEPFIESLVREPLVLVEEVTGLKFIPVPKPVELRMDCLRPIWAEEEGETPGAQIYPVQVMVYQKISFQSIRLLQSLTSILLNNFSRTGDILGQSGITTSQSSSILISLAIDLLSKGHLPKSIWQRTTPIDQISALIVQISPFITYGAMQIGDPNMVCASQLGFYKGLQKPKSAILMLPLCIRMLSGFMSLCIILLFDSTLKAQTICLKQNSTFFQGRGPSF